MIKKPFLFTICIVGFLTAVKCQNISIISDHPLIGNHIPVTVSCDQDTLIADFKFELNRNEVDIIEFNSSPTIDILNNNVILDSSVMPFNVHKENNRFELRYLTDSLYDRVNLIEFTLKLKNEIVKKSYFLNEYNSIITDEIKNKSDTVELTSKKCSDNLKVLFANKGTITSVEIVKGGKLIFEDSGYSYELLEFDFSDQEYGVYDIKYRTHDSLIKFSINYHK